MTNEYEVPSTPDMLDLQQLDEEYGNIRVPVRITAIEVPLTTHNLPARRAVMRNIVATEDIVQQLVGYDLRRKSLKIWGDAVANGIVLLGVRKDEVEQETATRWPVQINTGVNGTAQVLEMTHCEAVWVKAKGENANISFIAEYWAD